MATDQPNTVRGAIDPWGDRDWSPYYEAVGGKPPRDTMLAALEVTGAGGGRCAIDVGAGEGRDTREMLSRGYRVLAVDPHPKAQELLRRGLPADQAERLVVVRAGAEELAAVIAAHREFSEPVIVNASFSLPFVQPERFDVAWKAIRELLGRGGTGMGVGLAGGKGAGKGAGMGAGMRGGVFAGQFFGHLDTWASNPTRTHHRPEQVDELLRGLEKIQLIVDEKDGHDAQGTPKHWHVYHVVARAARS